MRGSVHSTNSANPKAGFNENQTNIEYYIQK
jgi:hypothetical protein